MSAKTEVVAWDADRLASPHTQPDKAQRVRRMFDCIAPTYELINRVASAGCDARWRRRMVQLAGVTPDDILLDVACGTGDVARTFAGANPRPQTVIGLDFSLPMLQHAAQRPVERGDFCQGDALRLPIADRAVSLVTCAFGIRNFQDLEQGLREMHRVLRPGGRAVLLEFSVPSNPVFRRLYLFYINRIMPRLATWISRDRTGAYNYLPSSVLSFQGREGIMNTLLRAGFSNVAAHPLSLGIVCVYVATRGSPERATRP